MTEQPRRPTSPMSRALAAIASLAKAGLWSGTSLPDLRYVGRYAKGTTDVERVCLCWVELVRPADFQAGGGNLQAQRRGLVQLKARKFRGNSGRAAIVLVGACPECGTIYHGDLVT